MWFESKAPFKERIAACYENAQNLKSTCRMRFAMVAERLPDEDLGKILYVEPTVLEGHGDAECVAITECLGGFRLGESLPIPVGRYGFERTETLLSSSGMTDKERRGHFTETVANLREDLAYLEDNPEPQDPSWRRSRAVLRDVIEYLEWVIEKHT